MLHAELHRPSSRRTRNSHILMNAHYSTLKASDAPALTTTTRHRKGRNFTNNERSMHGYTRSSCLYAQLGLQILESQQRGPRH